jgi:hypothetical protein
MARFVSHESPAISESIRANWWPMLGQDFGAPRQLRWSEMTEGEYGEEGFRAKNADEISPTQEALPIALQVLQSLDPAYGARKATIGTEGIDKSLASATQPAPSAPLEGTGNGADERAANPIGYIRADDLKELAAGNGAIISPRSGDTDVPVFARAPRAEVAEEQPSITNPLTPYGMLVRALRIVAGVTLMDMATALLTTPAKLSAMEFGRAPVTPEFAFDVAAYFDALDVPHTASALRAALAARAGEGQ